LGKGDAWPLKGEDLNEGLKELEKAFWPKVLEKDCALTPVGVEGAP